MKKPVLFGLLTLAMVPLYINPGLAITLGIAVIFAATLKPGGRNV
jgi:predicted membrane metal-binding protein